MSLYLVGFYNFQFKFVFQDAKSGPLKILRDQVRRNPSRLLKNMLQVETLLETGHYALPFASYIIFYVLL
jgi:hypothetical protein